MRQVREKILS